MANLTEEGMMRRYAWLLVLVAGCGRGDDRGRLATGTAAVVISPDPKVDFVEFKFEDGSKPAMIAAGTRVMVITDEKPDDSSARPVTVSARPVDLWLAGERPVGQFALIPRACLRPAR